HPKGDPRNGAPPIVVIKTDGENAERQKQMALRVDMEGPRSWGPLWGGNWGGMHEQPIDSDRKARLYLRRAQRGGTVLCTDPRRKCDMAKRGEAQGGHRGCASKGRTTRYVYSSHPSSLH
ncbi:MAG: hypothetical protein RLZZ453_1283, partial [Chlamydiota bacterium]